MRKFYDVLLEGTGGTSTKELFEKVDGENLPAEPGIYITNFGSLEYDGTTFRMNGVKRFPTTVDWWMIPNKP